MTKDRPDKGSAFHHLIMIMMIIMMIMPEYLLSVVLLRSAQGVDGVSI